MIPTAIVFGAELSMIQRKNWKMVVQEGREKIMRAVMKTVRCSYFLIPPEDFIAFIHDLWDAIPHHQYSRRYTVSCKFTIDRFIFYSQ